MRQVPKSLEDASVDARQAEPLFVSKKAEDARTASLKKNLRTYYPLFCHFMNSLVAGGNIYFCQLLKAEIVDELLSGFNV